MVILSFRSSLLESGPFDRLFEPSSPKLHRHPPHKHGRRKSRVLPGRLHLDELSFSWIARAWGAHRSGGALDGLKCAELGKGLARPRTERSDPCAPGAWRSPHEGTLRARSRCAEVGWCSSLERRGSIQLREPQEWLVNDELDDADCEGVREARRRGRAMTRPCFVVLGNGEHIEVLQAEI